MDKVDSRRQETFTLQHDILTLNRPSSFNSHPASGYAAESKFLS